jgi:hypothetical protein
MNIIIGMMSPEMNWAPKLEVNSFSFLSRNTSSTSGRRPNTFTSSWPVNASSMWAFRAPVWAHCATNSFCERFAICPVARIDSGMVTRAISASSGEITNIIASTPIRVSSEVSSWLIVCCRVWDTLSMSLVTRLSSSPRGWPSKNRRGSRLILSSTSDRSRNTVRCTTPLNR